jgi:transposase
MGVRSNEMTRPTQHYKLGGDYLNQQRRIIMTIKVLGIDLGKQFFHIYAVDRRGKLVVRKKLNRKQLLNFLSNLEPCLIGMEACGGSHYWARKAKEFGHTAKLMSAKFVKPYLKSNKNDFLDAEAISEAVQRPNMRFVTARTPEQQTIGAQVKLRESFISQRNAAINQVHGFMLEFGIEYPKGKRTLLRLPQILAEHEGEIPASMIVMLYRIVDEYRFLCEQISDLEGEMQALVSADDRGRRLLEMQGVGLITAACLLAWVGDARQFKSGRDMAAWIGLVPKQYSTGGKTTLLGIGKRGHRRLRCNLIHGARSSLQWHIDKPSRWSEWAKELKMRKAPNVVAVAMANKMARMAWVILARNERYQITANV